MLKFARTLFPVACATIGLLAACDSFTSAGGNGQVSLSFASAGVAKGAFHDISVTSGTHTLVLQSATVVLRDVELERTGAELDGDDEEEGDDEEISVGAVSVDMNFDGATETVLTVPMPAGTYEELEAEISTVRLKGTYDGQAFDVTVPVDAEIEADFDSPMVVADNDHLNITVKLDPAKWFTRADGSIINPASLASNSTLRAEVLARIRTDFRAFEDDDRDGDRDDD